VLFLMSEVSLKSGSNPILLFEHLQRFTSGKKEAKVARPLFKLRGLAQGIIDSTRTIVRKLMSVDFISGRLWG
jgi:hypothetical protein